MRLRHLFLLVLAGTAMSGCSLLGSRDKDAAPPTKIALSLYAAPSVNPNPNSVPPEVVTAASRASEQPGAERVANEGEGPYIVNLSGDSKDDLARNLRDLLEHLQEGERAGGPRPALEVPASLEARAPGIIAASPAARPAVSLAANLLDLQGVKASETNAHGLLDGLPPQSAGTPGRAPTLPARAPAPALGQYAEGPSEPEPVPEQDAPAPKAVSTPISFKVLQLKDDSLFLNADHALLTTDLKKALGSTYLRDDDYILQPGQFKFVDYTEIHKDARYLAVFANFHNQDEATWKRVLRLEPSGHKYALLVTFQDTEVAITNESYRQPQPRPKP